MSLGLIGKKQGMTRFFTEEGGSLPVTVVSVDANTITQIKTVAVSYTHLTLPTILLV